MERKVDEAAESCLRYHTALCRTPGRGTQAGLGQAKLIDSVQGHGIHSPASMLCKQAPSKLKQGQRPALPNSQQSVPLA